MRLFTDAAVHRTSSNLMCCSRSMIPSFRARKKTASLARATSDLASEPGRESLAMQPHGTSTNRESWPGGAAVIAHTSQPSTEQLIENKFSFLFHTQRPILLTHFIPGTKKAL